MFQSSPALVVNPSAYNDPATGLPAISKGGNGGAVYITAANTLYQFQATPIASPLDSAATAGKNLYVPNNATITGCGPISSPAVAATDVSTLPGNSLSGLMGAAGTGVIDSVRDWVYVGDNTLGLCRGFTPNQTSLGTSIPYVGPTPPTNPGTEATPVINYLPLRAYIFDGTTAHPATSTDMTKANPIGSTTLPAVFEWGTSAYIRFSNAVPPVTNLANPPVINTGVTDVAGNATGQALVIDPTTVSSSTEVAYGSGQAIQFQTTEVTPNGANNQVPDQFTIPPVSYAGAINTLNNGFYQRTGPLTATEMAGNALNTILGYTAPNTAGAIGAFSYDIAFGANVNKHNTPGARRRVINGTQRVQVYNSTDGGTTWTATGQYATLSTTNGTVTPPGPAVAATTTLPTAAATSGATVTVDQPTFGILNPLAVRGGGPTLGGTTTFLGGYQDGTQYDGIGPFRPLPASLTGATRYDLQALSNGNTVYTSTIPPSGNGSTGGTATSGQNPGNVAQANTASAASYPQQRVTIITATGFINHGTQGDNTTGPAASAPPVGSGTNGNSNGLSGSYFGPAGLDIADRSLVSVQTDSTNIPLGLQVVVQPTSRLQFQDNSYSSTAVPYVPYGIGAIINPLPWDDTFAIADRLTLGRNDSVDYPDIPRNAVTNEFATGGATLNTTGGGGVLPAVSNATANPATFANRQVNPASVRVQVAVPKYQPANLQEWDQGNQTGVNPKASVPTPANTVSRTVMGYIGTERVAANVRSSTVTGLPNVFDTTNAYRDITVYTGVPVDMSTSIQNTVTDVGTVPHGFGVQMDGYIPPSTGTAIGAFTPYNQYPGFAGHFMPLTIRNNGNTNLYNPHLDQKIVPYNPVTNTYTGSTNTLALLSDALNTDANAPLSYIAAYDGIYDISGNFGTVNSGFLVRSPLDTDLSRAYGINPIIAANPALKRQFPVATFHKPRVGDTQGTTMTVPDVSHDASIYSLNRAPGQLAINSANQLVIPGTTTLATTLPYVSVAVPLGTPVGTYSATLQMFEGYDNLYNSLIGPTYTNNNFTDTLALAQDKNAAGTVIDQRGVQPTSKPGTQIVVHVNEDRQTDSFTPGALPQIDTPVYVPATGTNPATSVAATNGGLGSADFAPAGYRDPQTGSLALYWTSSRNYAPGSTPPYSIFGTSLTFNGTAPYYQSNGFGHFTPASAQSWWTPITGNANALITSNNVTGTEFSVATNVDQTTGIPDGNAPYGFRTTITGSGTTTQYAIDCAQITGLGRANGLGTSVLVASSTQPKSGVHGLAIANVNFPDAAAPAGTTPANIGNNTWAFWTGGTRGRTALYYSSSVAQGTPQPFTTPATLPVPAGLVSVADANASAVQAPDVTSPTNAPVPAIEVTYSGVNATGNSDLYVSRFRPYHPVDAQGNANNALVLLGLMRMPQVNELLQSDPNSHWYQARDVGWARNGVLQVALTVTSTSGSALYTFGPNANGSIGETVAINGGNPTATTPANAKVVYDRASGLLVFTNVDLPSAAATNASNTLSGQSIFLDLATGRVRFSQPLPTGGATSLTTSVTATFNPTARRLTTSPAADTAPVAFLDRAYEANASNSGIINGVTPDPNVEADRYWVLWHKDAVGKTNPSLWYKTQRLTLALTGANGQPGTITLNGSGQPNVTVSVNGVTAYTPGGANNVVDVDATRGRLYFPILVNGLPTEGQTVTVTINGASVPGVIHWLDEPRYNDTSNQNAPGATETAADDGALVPITNIANESGVSAFLDPAAYGNGTGVAASQIPHNVWVFWTSTRNGTGDIFYETINPRFAATAP